MLIPTIILVSLATKHNRLGLFWALFWPLMTSLFFAALWFLSHRRSGDGGKLFLIMLGLVPLTNIPFDWLSIGVTRALLRRGGARGAHPALPVLLGLVDFAAGAVLLFGLACALILALQTADMVMIPGGADEPLIDVPRRLRELAETPAAAENWWIYFTLFSTLIPSALNLLIGTISLTTISSRRHRASLIRRIQGLKEKGHGSRRFGVSVGLAAPVFVGGVLAGLGIWGICLVLAYAGTKTLTLFLSLAEWFARQFPA